MKQAVNPQLFKQTKLLLFALILITAGCSLEKKSGFNKSMQNLTAHYNILFNANELLRQKQEAYAAAFIDNYNEVLNVYPDTTTFGAVPDKDMEAAILKANTIINIKEQSNYLGDAYLVLGKANYLSGNYFNAVEFFSYVIRSFPKRADLTQEALVWKTRGLIYLDELPQAQLTIDTAIKNVNPKKRVTCDVYAAKLQYDINAQNYTEGEEMAKQALGFCHEKRQQLRLRFILGQLQELNLKPAEAISNYAYIVGSNASFDMAFNANLNRIRIEDSQNGVKISRIDRLRELLKNQNNKDFTDQVYFQIAELQFAEHNIDDALKNYKLSVRYSVKNQNQKGLSYLRLAEIYFKNRADYTVAKKYYDSTLTSLSPNYPGYQAIQKKSSNLQVLTDRLRIISREDTLQALARMDDKARATKIDQMVNRQILQQQTVANDAAASPANLTNAVSNPQASLPNGNSFYFYNSTALSQGYADFRRKWGNRKLEDNWRRGNRPSSDQTNNAVTAVQATDPDAPAGELQQGITAVSAGNYRQDIIQHLPLTPVLLAQSNQRVYNAYVDIGNFYRDILEDKKEAINAYELILNRFPDDPNKPAIYYNLYRLYSESNKAKSDDYKNRLLKDYSNTPFAKVIADPDYAKRLDDENAGFTIAYNKVYDLFANKQYKAVIAAVPPLVSQYPGNKYAAQLYYLQTIAAGHQETLTPFRDSLQQIAKRYPDDRLITPLVNQHLAYINANQAEMLTRSVVLPDEDPNEIVFTLEPSLKIDAAYRAGNTQDVYMATADVRKPEVKQEPQKTTVTAPVKPEPVQVTPEPLPKQQDVPIAAAPTVQPQIETAKPLAIERPKPVSLLFSERDSTNYYFVVYVNSGTVNLASSRFGIGQFNRANYPGSGIKHQLKNVDADDQLIFVGRFSTLNEVKNYARGIIPLLPDIMKVPKDRYGFFIATKENVDKLADRKTLDSYIDYYQKYY